MTVQIADPATDDAENRHRLQPTPVETLLPGDVLLMRGRGDFSTLVAWCGDSIYSHVAMVGRDGNLLEAATKGVAEASLADRLKSPGTMLVDAFRPLANDLDPLTADDCEAVMKHATSLLGTGFAMDQLATIGVIVAVRNKVFPDAPAWFRRLLYLAFRHASENDPSKMICSEFVYRCFAENNAMPSGRLAPQIVIAASSCTPFPDIDWRALIKEVMKLRGKHDPALKAMAGLAEEGTTDPAIEAWMTLEPVSDAELAAAAAAVRARFGSFDPGQQVLKASTGSETSQGGAGWPVVESPNPKQVRPRDFADTPCQRPLGRLMRNPHWRD
ncbi:MAG: hypothetical protein M3374_04440 [Pseudomonadota bacterium]|nr:hypothetical protein [Pseudomonadota bacterium]